MCTVYFSRQNICLYIYVFQFLILFKQRQFSDFNDLIFVDFRVQDLTERFETSQKGQTQIQEDLAYKENELEVNYFSYFNSIVSHFTYKDGFFKMFTTYQYICQ